MESIVHLNMDLRSIILPVAHIPFWRKQGVRASHLALEPPGPPDEVPCWESMCSSYVGPTSMYTYGLLGCFQRFKPLFMQETT